MVISIREASRGAAVPVPRDKSEQGEFTLCPSMAKRRHLPHDRMRTLAYKVSGCVLSAAGQVFGHVAQWTVLNYWCREKYPPPPPPHEE